MFELRDIGVIRHGRQVVRDLRLSVDNPGALMLIGPGGAGKSSLLRAVAGEIDPGMTVNGEALLDGVPCGDPSLQIGWYPQHTGIEVGVRAQRHGAAEQRRSWSATRLRALHEFLQIPRALYILDEPTAEMTDEDEAQVRAWLKPLAERAFVLMATHNRQDCLALGGTTAIFHAGSVLEAGISSELFSDPQTDAGKHYVATGSLSGYVMHSRQPASDGVWWVVPGMLCGMSRPGMVAPIELQFQQLVDAGVRHLVSLEEQGEELTQTCRSFGIEHHHYRMSDMSAPTMKQAMDLCRMAEEAIGRNEGVAFHCRGGLGRTGTAIAAVLIWYGEPADAAIVRVRNAQSYAIQSQAQMQFLNQFADRLMDGWTPVDLQRAQVG